MLYILHMNSLESPGKSLQCLYHCRQTPCSRPNPKHCVFKFKFPRRDDPCCPEPRDFMVLRDGYIFVKPDLHSLAIIRTFKTGEDFACSGA